MQCKLCDKPFPTKIYIDGKQRNLRNRKYCLDCSPFGRHNTRALTGFESLLKRQCEACGKDLIRKSEKGKMCWVCTNRNNRREKIEKIKGLVGSACWFCGYSRCWEAMDFHHVDPEQKLFNLTTRELQFSWERVVSEVKKCVLTCARCHREIHAGVIGNEQVYELWRRNWNEV